MAAGVVVPRCLITAQSQPSASSAHLVNVADEATAIQAALGGAAIAEIQTNISVADLGRLLGGRSLWCFPGHGDAMLHSEPTLAFVAANGQLEAVSIDTIVATVKPHVLNGDLKLILLTGCRTAQLASALHDHAFVPYVACWETVLDDEAGRIFGTAFALAHAEGATPPLAFEAARTAVLIEREPGMLDTGMTALVQKFELDIDPLDVSLVFPDTGRLRTHPGASCGRLAAGTPKLMCCESTALHDVPATLPAAFQVRPEYFDLRASLVDVVRGAGVAMVGIVGTSPVTGIAGTAGLGKTTTAVWLAHDPIVRNAFRDGIYWLEFGKMRTALQRLVRLAEMLGVPYDECDQLERRGEDAVRDVAARRLRGRSCLVVLDDVWNEEQPRPFQQLAGEGVVVLMTTRKVHIVDTFGEQLARLPLRPMADEVATRLLVESSGREQGELHGPSVEMLVKMCAGLPAMLRSVGRMCRQQSAEATVRWFDDHKLCHRMPTSMARADGYQQDAAKGNLFLAYEGQLDELAERDDELALRFTMLAIFPEDTKVPLTAIEKLWGTDESETREAVERLVSENLMLVVDDGARIQLLDPVRDYLGCRGKSDLVGWQARFLRALRTSKVGDQLMHFVMLSRVSGRERESAPDRPRPGSSQRPPSALPVASQCPPSAVRSRADRRLRGAQATMSAAGTGYNLLDELASMPSSSTDESSVAADVEAGEQPPTQIPADLPFEAWHFRHSAYLHNVVMTAMMLVSLDQFRYNNLSAGSYVDFVTSVVVLACRIAVHSCLEPVRAQALASAVAFGTFAISLLAYSADLGSITKEEAQQSVVFDLVFIPTYSFLMTTFAFPRWQILLLQLIAVMYNAGLLYIASDHWSEPAITAFASNVSVILIFVLWHALSIAFAFGLDNINRQSYRGLIESRHAAEKGRRRELELEVMRRAVERLESRYVPMGPSGTAPSKTMPL